MLAVSMARAAYSREGPRWRAIRCYRRGAQVSRCRGRHAVLRISTTSMRALTWVDGRSQASGFLQPCRGIDVYAVHLLGELAIGIGDCCAAVRLACVPLRPAGRHRDRRRGPGRRPTVPPHPCQLQTASASMRTARAKAFTMCSETPPL